METKSDRFSRLAEARVNKAIASIRSIGKLSNRAHYEFQDPDIRKIFSALKRELEEARGEFDASNTRSGKGTFRLKD